MSIDPTTVIKGAHVALTIIRELQKAVNSSRQAGKELDLATVQAILDKNTKAEQAWEDSKEKKAESATPAKKPAAKKAAAKKTD